MIMDKIIFALSSFTVLMYLWTLISLEDEYGHSGLLKHNSVVLLFFTGSLFCFLQCSFVIYYSVVVFVIGDLSANVSRLSSLELKCSGCLTSFYIKFSTETLKYRKLSKSIFKIKTIPHHLRSCYFLIIFLHLL